MMTFAEAQANEWRGIVPLRSTKTDVEKLLGKPIEGSHNLYLYDTEKERVSVLYSDGMCNENKSSTFNVPRDRVLTFMVSPKKTMNVSEITEKSSQSFEREADLKEDAFHYKNKDGSVRFETIMSENGIEDIIYIIYKATKTDDSLLCSCQ
jgi:hypothetical protein